MSWIKDFIVLTIFIGTLFGATVGRYPISAPDGARYAEIPREMVVNHDYITPHLNNIKYFEKPPLFYWLQAISIKMFGANEVSVSIVNALFAFGCCIIIYIIGRKLYNRLSGMIASIIFATTCLVFALTRIVTLDMALTFFITGSLGSFILANQLLPGTKRNLYFWATYVFMALSVMTKGLVGVIFPCMIIFIWVAVFNQWGNLKTYRIISGLFIFLLITLPWHILVQIKNHEFFHFYFIQQHFLRYLTTYASRTQKWWFFPATLIGGLYPWIVFLPQTIFYYISNHLKQWHEQKSLMFLIIWAISIYIFYSFSNSKLIPYLLPIFPPITILLGNYLATHWQDKQYRSISFGFYTLFILNIIFGICAIAAIFKLNFKELTITKQNLYVIAICMIMSAILCIVAYIRRGLVTGFTVIAITSATLLLYISPIITTVNNQSIKPLIVLFKQKLKPEDDVICYGSYYQDLPFYLRRQVTVVNYSGELAFGMEHQNTKAWMIDTKDFLEHWNSNKHVYLLTNTSNYQSLLPTINNIHVLGKYLDTILITNFDL